MGQKDIHKYAVPFKKGDDERRNTTGLNKGSKWNKNLLKDLLSVNVLAEDSTLFESLKNKFPKIFNSSDEKNLQLFVELKQIGLIFSEVEAISQKAITEVKDRIEGKSKQEIDNNNTHKVEPLLFQVIGKDGQPT